MNEEQYIQTQEQILLLAKIVHDLPLREFIAAGRHAEAIGPIVDPTLWIKASANLADVIHLAVALRKFQAEIERQLGDASSSVDEAKAPGTIEKGYSEFNVQSSMYAP